MQLAYELTNQRNFYAISVGQFADYQPVDCFKEDAYTLAQGFQARVKCI